ncbi:hypothetical protein FVEG_16059 [Fusarium verticillioides 7600]|uniref:Uncharacterized protein n=1 Tax=Gibberella moniliformis (strain M3125 / FGSC 7600) TaxID=334819 RepID=W7M7N7_GIBM7|nr:hypothetical protein FVEG_16059 [Fusarium verticillioides 7600]EWG47016.1 hypothetical protein FVEG_16059 [Fusarium verticillioides 7600]
MGNPAADKRWRPYRKRMRESRSLASVQRAYRQSCLALIPRYDLLRTGLLRESSARQAKKRSRICGDHKNNTVKRWRPSLRKRMRKSRSLASVQRTYRRCLALTPSYDLSRTGPSRELPSQEEATNFIRLADVSTNVPSATYCIHIVSYKCRSWAVALFSTLRQYYHLGLGL